MLRKAIAVFLVVLVILVQLAPMTFAASIRTKKVVSVVYDDSGSMYMKDSPKWAYANYAMQAFAGILNKEDSLYISYMSENYAKEINLNNKNSEVDSIRERAKSGNTPLETIDTAFNKLKSHSDNNANTQYWLVVMTDGQFYDSQENAIKLEVVEKKLKSMAETKMPNGSSPEIVFLSMCDEKGEFTPSKSLHSNISVEEAKKADDIMTTISSIADKVSGRYATDSVKIIDGKTIEVKSDIPLLSIGVLTQHSTALVKSISFSEGKGNVESNVGLKYPQVDGRVTDNSLVGNVALINNGDKNIPTGTYTITFSEEIDKNDIKVLFEPALELKIKLLQDGKEVKDPNQLPADSAVSAIATLYESGTDNKIDLSLLPEEYTQSISCSAGGKEIASTSGSELADIMLKDEGMVIEADFNVDGFFNLYQKLEFTPINIKIVDMTAELHYDGSKRLNKDDGENVIYTSALKENRTGVLFTLFTEDGPIDKARAEGLRAAFKANVETKLSPIEVEVQDDGRLLVYPTKAPIHSNIIYWLRFNGEQPVTGNYSGVSATETLIIKPDWLSFLPEIWLLVILLRIIITAIFRKTFGKLKIVCQLGSKQSRNDNIFAGVPETSVHLSKPSAVFTLIKIILPIPVIPLWLLLKPGKKKIGYGLKAVPIQPRRTGTSFNLEGLKGKAYVRNECYNKISLPSKAGRRNENENDGDTVSLNTGSVITIELGGDQFLKIKVR